MPNITEDEYRELLRNFSQADPTLQKEIVDQIAMAYLEDMRRVAQKYVGSDQHVSLTSVVNATYERILGFFSRGGQLECYESRNAIFAFFQKTVHSALIDKYRRECRERGIPFEDEASDVTIEPSIPDEFVKGMMTRELAEKLLELLREILHPEDVDLLMRRFVKGETYAQIIAQDDRFHNNDAARMRIKRIQERLARSPKIRKLKED